jgi:uncharacterized membrane protein
MPASSIVVLLTFRQDPRVRFHAAQGIVLGAVLIIINRLVIYLGGVIASGSLASGATSTVVGLVITAFEAVSIGVWGALVLIAFHGETWHVPLLGKVADKGLALLPPVV